MFTQAPTSAECVGRSTSITTAFRHTSVPTEVQSELPHECFSKKWLVFLMLHVVPSGSASLKHKMFCFIATEMFALLNILSLACIYG